MNKFIERIANDDVVWTTITGSIVGARRSNTSFINFNCPMCVLRGESADTKQRCGAKRSHEGVGISCFNCSFKSRWKPGETLSKGMRAFMRGIGVSSTEVKRINLKLFQYRRIIESSPEAQSIIPVTFAPNFTSARLPKGSKTFMQWAEEGCHDPNFLRVVEYTAGRGDDIFGSTNFYWTPDTRDDMHQRVIVPFYFQGQIVGYAGRYVGDERKTRYWQSVPTDYLFNNRVLYLNQRRYNIIVEGVFDALAIDGVTPLGAKMSDRQAMWLNGSGKTNIYVADRDSSGGRAIDFAIKNKWHVAFPRLRSRGWWEHDVKDAAQATQRYGRLYTLRSILETATNNKTKIDTYRKMMV